MGLIYFIYLMISNSWSTVPHNSLRDVPLVFGSIFSFLVALVLFTDRVNMVAVSLSVFVVAMMTVLYGIGQRFLFDPLFPQRLRSRKTEYEGKDLSLVPTFFQNKEFQDSRAISSLGNTNFACGFFITTIPFILFLSSEVSSLFYLSLLAVI